MAGTIVRARTPRTDLTARQAEVLEFIEARVSAGMPFPGIRAIADYIGAKDPTSAYDALLGLAGHGWIRHVGWETTGRRQRIWQVVPEPPPTPSVVQAAPRSPQVDSALGWNDWRVALLKKLWADGFSASVCAQRLGGGLSRNAVIGKIHRLGLALRGNARPTFARKPQRRTPIRSLRSSPRPMPAWKQALREMQTQPLPPEPVIPPHERMPILVRKDDGLLHANDALTEACCRWPAGDPQDPDFGFCGKQKVAGLPYCEQHARRAFAPPAPRGPRSPAFAPPPVTAPAEMEKVA